MGTWDDVRVIAGELPETSEGLGWGRPAFLVRDKWFVLQREPRPDAVDETGARIEGLIVLYVEDLEAKDTLAADDSGYFMTTPHFANSRMILVHLEDIPVDELREVMIESWLVRAPKRLARAYLEGTGER
ncbi:MmcQ/YjbR family DNA-binding protein [Ornithinimicrobium sp. F0845]|uniref:MmcQ/YjbR family DNA-binding protein n=1 Tax=Ornithinimicrobium sp. F0845 TaxID=2926412 RepID=UPI001FF1A446|nr:MmcQ/YjbR family DNA-binding protein [Ornithinimicrobium sp. F0845]MCK0112146.1 MmcQ/YjbR family DNA-binding protein [Ornithinimicrobium sp. F0845]